MPVVVNRGSGKCVQQRAALRENLEFMHTERELFIYVLDLGASQPHRVPSGLFTKSNLTEVEHNTKHAHFTNVKHNKYINI